MERRQNEFSVKWKLTVGNVAHHNRSRISPDIIILSMNSHRPISLFTVNRVKNIFFFFLRKTLDFLVNFYVFIFFFFRSLINDNENNSTHVQYLLYFSVSFVASDYVGFCNVIDHLFFFFLWSKFSRVKNIFLKTMTHTNSRCHCVRV